MEGEGKAGAGVDVFLLSRLDLLSDILLREERNKDSVSACLPGVSWDMSEATATSRRFSMGSVSLM